MYEIIYISTLSDDFPVTVAAQIAVHARVKNALHEITGFLIFDGFQFCQQLEGDQAAVQALLDVIKSDRRHVQLKVLHAAPLFRRRFMRFAMGLATLGDDEDLLHRLGQLEGHGAVNSFLAAIPKLDKKSGLSG